MKLPTKRAVYLLQVLNKYLTFSFSSLCMLYMSGLLLSKDVVITKKTAEYYFKLDYHVILWIKQIFLRKVYYKVEL